MKVTEEMVSRFLSWRLPNDFAPDAGISFTPSDHPDALTHLWPTGTNLLTADQARTMLEHVIAGGGEAEQQAKDAEAWREHCKVMQAASMPGALHIRLTMNEKGKAWGIEYVLDADRFGRSTLGLKAVGLAAERKAEELFHAIGEYVDAQVTSSSPAPDKS